MMTRRNTRTPVHLHPAEIQELPFIEIRAILRGADPLIGSGGRTMLVKLLRGSREKKVLELGLDEVPVYGIFHDLSEEGVLEKIDWLITHHYLQYFYDGRLPLLEFAPAGWEIERQTYAEELFAKLTVAMESGNISLDMIFLKDRNREIIWLLLDILATRGDARYIPFLESWERIEYKKVRSHIRWAMQQIRARTLL
jgi:hypothetical protein